MATRGALKQLFRRFSSGSGRVLNEEEKAAENIYIKKVEQEKLEKLASKGPKPEEKASPSPGGSSADAKPSPASSAPGASSAKASTDSYKNYAIIGGALTVVGALGLYLKSGSKKSEEVKD